MRVRGYGGTRMYEGTKLRCCEVDGKQNGAMNRRHRKSVLLLLAHTVAYCAPWVLSAARIHYVDTVQGWWGPPSSSSALLPPTVARSMTLFSRCHLVLLVYVALPRP